MLSGIDPPAGARLPRRQLVLFVVALIVPSLVLVALSLRMIAQERELGIARLDYERRQVVAAVRQELLVGLERAKIRALAGAATGPLDEHIAIVGAVDRGRLLLPWDQSPSADRFRAAIEQGPFAGHLSRGEHAELRAGRHASAADAYRLAIGAARDPVQRGYAGLLLARTLAKVRQHDEARTLLRSIAAIPPVITDEHGVPLALYAAERLLDVYPDADAVGAGAKSVEAVVRSVRWVPPAGAHLMLSVAERAAPPDLLSAVRRRVDDVEQGLALQQAAPSLLPQFPADGRDPVWIRFGTEPWLVGLGAAADGGARLLAVRPGSVFASLGTVKACRASGSCNVRLAGPADMGEVAGPGLPGLKIAYEQRESGAPAALSRPFYIAALALVLAVTLLGGVVLWYDMRRELRVAELRSQFVSSVSHELKTPLTAIRMFAETLRLGRVPDELTRDEYLDTIVSESERLTRLLNNVLDFSRIEQGRKVYHLAPHPLSNAVGAAARAMHYPLAQQQLELVVSIDETLPPLAIDPDAVEQAVLNLLTNAMKYSGSGRRIDLRVARERGHAVVTVADQGMGIPAAEQPRIFEKFYRVQTPENRSIPGTGLGLTLVQHIARGHGGFVRVDSAPGAGSRFSIHLPLDAAPRAEIDRGGSREAREADAGAPPLTNVGATTE